jgi:hypothetical protein
MRELFASLLLVTVLAAPSYSQSITLFNTLKDYESGKGRAIGEYQGYEWSKEGVLLLTPPEKGKKPVVHDVSAAWGYQIGEHVYRLYKGLPHVILKQGAKGIYYENGLAHMDMSLEVKDRSDVEYGKYCFLSASIESPIVYIPSKDATKAFEKNTDIQAFLTCIEKFKWTDAKKIRECLPKLD